ncbi:MAG TPA: cytidylate kinase, partial [Sphaerochaetaceae bacterium]|nr:cytidylate kinase [Sphaerochaetaceae bacterium]
MRIAISGKSGCGNTTVSTLVAQRLDYPLINFTFRNLAKERGIDFWDFCRMAEEDDSIDRE